MSRSSSFRTCQIIETEIDLGGIVAPVRARVNRRAKRLIVKVDSVFGRVLVTAPSKRALPEALAFALERADWIRSELEAGRRALPFVEGGVCPYLGEAHRIVRDGGPRTPVRRISGPKPEIQVGGDPTHVNRRLVDWLKREARAMLTARADRYCAQLGKTRGPLRIRDTRSHWGSCSADGTLSFSWRLILAPERILDYVAAHECAHLVHLDHSRAYWTTLAELGVDARSARDWFDEHGASLYAYGVNPGPSENALRAA
ncbi:MAG: M48 family metallopeptidase [Parvularculaceae bacterium]